MPVCLLVLAQTRRCITSRSPGHTCTAVWGEGCWLVKRSSHISGNSFVPGGFVELRVDAAPAILWDTSDGPCAEGCFHLVSQNCR